MPIHLQVTKNPEYRRRGWQMFSALERFAKHKGGGYCAMTAASTLKPMCGDFDIILIHLTRVFQPFTTGTPIVPWDMFYFMFMLVGR